MYGQRKKKIETIETDEEYYDIVRSSRNPPVEIIRESDCTVRDFETSIPGRCNIPKNLQIKDAMRIDYFGNESVEVYYGFDRQPKSYQIESNIDFEELLQEPLAQSVRISSEKLKDVTSLLRYLSPTGKKIFENLLQNASI